MALVGTPLVLVERMLVKPPECEGCVLATKGTGFAQPSGSGALGVLIVGEALGREEANQGRAFVEWAQAGSLLERTFKMCGFDRQQFRLYNIVNCQPPGDWLDKAPWEFGAINHCAVHRNRVIREMKPRVILALGNIAMRVLTGKTGKAQGITYLRGYVLPMLDTDIPVVGGFHPSFIRRGKSNLVNTLAHDLRKAVDIAQGRFTNFCLHPDENAGEYVQYITHPGLDDFKSYMFRCVENQGAILSLDLETSNSPMLEEDSDDEVQLEVDAGAVTQMQFSLCPKEAIAVPWAGEYRTMAKQILTMPHIKAAHNGWRFDLPVMAREHVKVNGVVHDTRWMWHHLQPDLPANLQFVSSFYGMPFPWKHLAAYDEAFYGCADADAVSRIMSLLPKQLSSKAVYEGYERQVVGLEPILVDMSRRGIPVDNERRLALGEKISAARDAKRIEAQQYWPEKLHKFHPAKGYVRPPADKTGLIQREFPELKQEGQFELLECTVTRWCKALPFNPGSGDQLKEYMRHVGHPVPKVKGKETTAETELLKVAKKTKDPIYKCVLEYREYDKMYGTYVLGWEPDSNGFVHPSYNYGTAVGQLASKNPNGQNFPIRSDLGKEMRGMIMAKSSHKLIEIDMSAFHAVTLAFEAASPNWMRLARSDIHSFTTAHFLKLPGRETLLDLPDDELVDTLARIKKEHKLTRDNKAKHAILGVGNGLGYRKLYRTYWEFFTNEKEAKTLLDIIKAIFPEIFRYQNQRRLQAHKQTYLISRWKYLRWFFDVMHWDAKSQTMVPGDDSEAAIAYHHVNDAFGLMREIMLWMRANEYDRKFKYSNTIHDSNIFHCPSEHADECIHVMYEYSTRRHPTLIEPVTSPNGLYVDAEVKVGPDWRSLETVLKGKPTGANPASEPMVFAPIKFDVEYFVPTHPPIILPYGGRRSYEGEGDWLYKPSDMQDINSSLDDVPF